MRESLLDRVKAAAEAWARETFQVTEAVGYAYEDEGDEPGRYIVSLAIPTFDEWQAAEVWVEDDRVTTINWLGEGLPPDDLPESQRG